MKAEHTELWIQNMEEGESGDKKIILYAAAGKEPFYVKAAHFGDCLCDYRLTADLSSGQID